MPWPGTREIPDSGGGGVGGPMQNHNIGWKARQRSSAAASSSSQADPRAPLAKLAEGDSNSRKGPRPHEVPYASNASGLAAESSSRKAVGAKEAKGITLRCMYTSQKAKKRKTWSDGAVKCCPTRLRVSLYRWSEALGVTDKLLGEIYLTAPQYQAFIDQGEPELEMEEYLVSLDGVIQPDADDASVGTAGPAAGGPNAGAATTRGGGGGSCGSSAGGVGKKRKLFKAFKPPARRAAPPAPPFGDDGWGLPQQQHQQQQQRGRVGRRPDGEWPGDDGFQSPAAGVGDGRDRLPPRTSYTGFGHVESLWDDDGGGGDGGGGGDEVEDRAPRDGGAWMTGLAGEGNAGWGMVAGTGHRRAHDGDDGHGGRRGGMYPDFRSETAPPPQQLQPHVTPSSASSTRNSSGQQWENEEGGGGQHIGAPSSGGWSSRPPVGFEEDARPSPPSSGDFAVRSDGPPGVHPAQRGGGQGDLTPCLEGRWGGGTGAEGWPSSTARSPPSGGAGFMDGAVRRHDEPQLHVRNGSVVEGWYSGAEGEPFGSGAVADTGAGARTPERSREPAGGGSGGSGGGDGGLRSTQEILSLFGGLGADGDGHGSPRGRETAADAAAAAAAATPDRRSHGPNESRLVGPGDPRADPAAAGGGMPRAADMRRAQREARAAATTTAAVAAAAGEATGAADGEVHAEPAGAAGAELVERAAGGSLQGDWACEVCGVTGGASSTSCRVCGAPKRQAPPPGEVVAVPGGGHRGVDESRGGGGSDAHHRGWSGGGGGGGEGWQEQGWEGKPETGGAGEGSLGVGAARGISRQDLRGSSPWRPSSTPGSKGGGTGGICREAAGASRPSSQLQMGGGRMKIDVGSSSDSDDA